MEEMEFMNKFKPNTRCIKEFKYWIICIRKKQATIGSSVILLKRKTDSIAKLKKEESIEFVNVINWFENLCREKFNAVKFNYNFAMMKDNFVHCHAFPRYEKEIELFGKKWPDNKFDSQAVIDLKDATEVEDEILEKIRNYMSN